MNKSNIIILFSFVIIGATIINAIFLQDTEAIYSIPPTPAFNNITDGTTIIAASNYSDRLFLTAGENMTLQYFPTNNTIRFTALVVQSGGGGGGDNLGDHTATQNLALSGFNMTFKTANDFIDGSSSGLYSFFAGGDEVMSIRSAGLGIMTLKTGGSYQIEQPNGVVALQSSVTSANTDFQAKDANQLRFLTEDLGGTLRSTFWLAPLDEHRAIIGSADHDTQLRLSSATAEDNNIKFYENLVGACRIWHDVSANRINFDENTAGECDEFTMNDMDFAVNNGYNLAIGNNRARSNGDNTLEIASGNNPSSAVSNTILLYSNDTSGSSELYVMDEAGNTSILSPHNFDHVERKSVTDWSYTGYNPYTGKGVSISNYEVIRALEEITGKTLIHEFQITGNLRNWNADQLLIKQDMDKDRQHELNYKQEILDKITETQALLQNRNVNSDVKILLQADLLELENELTQIIIPNPYIIKPRPDYFDMVEITR